MLHFVLALVGDIIVFKLMWRGYKMATQGFNQLFEVESGYRTRVKTGWGIVIFCVILIIFNHVFF